MAKKETKKEVVVEESVKEEKVFTEEEVKEIVKKERKEAKEKPLWQKIVNVVLWIIVIGWMAIFVIDFIKVQKKTDPIFCLKNTTIKSGTGTADVCTGPGYKVYKYHCSTKKGENYNGALEFGPFWTDSVCDRLDEE